MIRAACGPLAPADNRLVTIEEVEVAHGVVIGLIERCQVGGRCPRLAELPRRGGDGGDR